ncbi:UNKNOWN [Stylonychia lemnae]|uniref:Uncharacterized protein n=1 Tax=Stylonychia lemnae TaxID=5949 RepID=A0A078A9U6_STYLE|nr:UNKNOWN [Stylonychia lemnae]|eukprot:CDW77568.1 UNKNOWN [Stylonychia lemnae]
MDASWIINLIQSKKKKSLGEEYLPHWPAALASTCPLLVEQERGSPLALSQVITSLQSFKARFLALSLTAATNFINFKFPEYSPPPLLFSESKQISGKKENKFLFDIGAFLKTQIRILLTFRNNNFGAPQTICKDTPGEGGPSLLLHKQGTCRGEGRGPVGEVLLPK